MSVEWYGRAIDLVAFMDAWNRRDADACAALMHRDGVWLDTAGLAEGGAEHRGREAVRDAARAMFEAYPGAAFETRGASWIADDRALCEWTWSFTTRSGRVHRAWGIDVLTLRDGLIAVKDSYIKRVNTL